MQDTMANRYPSIYGARPFDNQHESATPVGYECDMDGGNINADNTDNYDGNKDNTTYLIKLQCKQNFVILVYFVLASVAVLSTIRHSNEWIDSINNPARSTSYSEVERYDAPGIAIFPDDARLLSCRQYFNNIVTSKVRLSELHLTQRNCTFINVTYDDPFEQSTQRSVLMFRGPTQIKPQKEAAFFHFMLEDETRDFHTIVFYVFQDWNKFKKSSPEEQHSQALEWHKTKPTYALSSGLRMWIKLTMKKTQLQLDGYKNTSFEIEYSVVEYHDRRPKSDSEKHSFFVFLEWKDNIIKESCLQTTTDVLQTAGSLCGVLLVLYKVFVFSRDSVRGWQSNKCFQWIRKCFNCHCQWSRNSNNSETSDDGQTEHGDI